MTHPDFTRLLIEVDVATTDTTVAIHWLGDILEDILDKEDVVACSGEIVAATTPIGDEQ